MYLYRIIFRSGYYYFHFEGQSVRVHVCVRACVRVLVYHLKILIHKHTFMAWGTIGWRIMTANGNSWIYHTISSCRCNYNLSKSNNNNKREKTRKRKRRNTNKHENTITCWCVYEKDIWFGGGVFFHLSWCCLNNNTVNNTSHIEI